MTEIDEMEQMATIYTAPSEQELKATKRKWGGVTKYMAALGTPMVNVRQSWGAQHPSTRAVYSLIWIDEFAEIDGAQHAAVLRLDPPAKSNYGYREREHHLEEVQSTGIQHYGVPVTYGGNRSKGVVGFDDTTLLVLENKRTPHDGVYYARILDTIPVEREETQGDAAPMDEEHAQAAESFASDSKFTEGTRRTIITTAPERDPAAREACIAHYRREDGVLQCQACGWTKPAGITRTIIEVHHITPVSNYVAETEIDPTTDLIPLCPTCHRIAHDTEPPMSVGILRSLVAR
ncbi:MAG: hypothetical protein EOM91_17950 [Sphingobacteriia bacterium]|nr:hypothetical protein [Sphingobacteriia bacterium]